MKENNLNNQGHYSREYQEFPSIAKLTSSSSSQQLYPYSTQNKLTNDTFKYFIELNKNLSSSSLKNNTESRRNFSFLQITSDNFTIQSSYKKTLSRHASILIEKLFNYVKHKLSLEQYEDLKKYFSIEYAGLINDEKLMEKEEKIIRTESLSSIKEILNYPNSRNAVNSNMKKNLERFSSPINLYKGKEKLMKNISSNNSFKNLFPSAKISNFEREYNSNINFASHRTNETIKILKSLKYSFDFNRKNVPPSSSNISISDYYLSRTKQFNKKTVISPRIDESNSKQILAEDKKVGIASKGSQNILLMGNNKMNCRYINTTSSNNSNAGNSNQLSEKVAKDLKKNSSRLKPQKATIHINQNLPNTKILNDNLMNYLSNKKSTNSKLKTMTKKHKTEKLDKKKNYFYIPNRNETKSNMEKPNSMATSTINQGTPSNVQSKISKIQPTEISINLKDLCDSNYFLSEIEKTSLKSKKTNEKSQNKNSEKDFSNKTETSKGKSISITNNFNDFSSPNNSNSNTNNYKNLSDRQHVVVHTQPSHQKHCSVAISQDFMKEIKLNIDDNLKNLFNFSYENFYKKEIDNSDLLSNSDDEKSRYQRKCINESNINEFQTEEMSNNNLNNDIMFTNEISFDKAEENLKEIVFRKK